jgi:hypothetical protein
MRRIVRTIVGSFLLLAGLLMLVLPGPAVIVIPLGLAILAIDFPWAKAMMQKVRIGLIKMKVAEPDSLNPAKGGRAMRGKPPETLSVSVPSRAAKKLHRNLMSRLLAKRDID